MAYTFSYTFDLSPDKKTARFKADNGEEYLVIHELTWTIYGNSILNLAVECNVPKNVLVIAELCSASINSLKCSALLDDCRAELNFQNVNYMTHDPWRCIIHVVPHLILQDLQDTTVPLSSLIPIRRRSIKRKKLEELSADMGHILSTGELSDVILTDGSRRIPAHKVILSARSQVFARMFQNPMRESSENSVLISDISGEVLMELVSFLYTGTITVEDKKMAINLYMAADKYAVANLKAVCSEVLKTVTFEDVLDTLALADLYEDKVLKESCLSFISKYYSQVKSAKNWEGFMKENQALAIEILSFVIENKV